MAERIASKIARGITRVFSASDEGASDAPIDTLEFIGVDDVFLAEGVSCRDKALGVIAQRAVELGHATDAAELAAAFLKREEEGTTGMMDGIAIPHAKCSAVVAPRIMVMGVPGGVEGWDTMDGAPVTCAIAMLVPATGMGTVHLKMLARIAEAMMDDAFRRDLRAATDRETVVSIIACRLS